MNVTWPTSLPSTLTEKAAQTAGGQFSAVQPAPLGDRVKLGAQKKWEAVRQRFALARAAFVDSVESETRRQTLWQEHLKRAFAGTTFEARQFGLLYDVTTGERLQILEGERGLADFDYRRVERDVKIRALNDTLEVLDAQNSHDARARYQSNDRVRLGTNYYLLKIFPEKYRRTVSITEIEETK